MCFQLTGLAMQAAGTGMSAAGAYYQASSQNLARRYNYHMLERNAELAETQAQDAATRGQEASAEWKRMARNVMSKQRAAAAGAGVSVWSGSIAQAQAAAQLAGNLGAERLRVNAEREAWYLRMQALMYESQAKMTRASRVSPALAVTTSLLGGFGNMAGSFQSAMNGVKNWQNTVPTMPSTSGLATINWGGVKGSPAGLLSEGFV